MNLLLQTNDVKVSIHEIDPSEIGKSHFHSNVCEHVFCLSGCLEINISSPEESVILNIGESALIQSQRIHYVSNISPSISKYLLIQGVGAYDFIMK